MLVAFEWMRAYFGTIHFDPAKELRGIPPHSAFFIIDHNNRCVCVDSTPPISKCGHIHTHARPF